MQFSGTTPQPPYYPRTVFLTKKIRWGLRCLPETSRLSRFPHKNLCEVCEIPRFVLQPAIFTVAENHMTFKESHSQVSRTIDRLRKEPACIKGPSAREKSMCHFSSLEKACPWPQQQKETASRNPGSCL